MTPVESHETALSLSRERLARAIAKFGRLARDASETISGLRQEKQGLERRLADLTKLVEQERSNFQQRAALLSSANSETEERAKAADELNLRLIEQELLMNEQLGTITHLEAELEANHRHVSELQEIAAAGMKDQEDSRAKVQQLQGRLDAVVAERDAMKSQLYQHEREEAQFALRMTPEDRDKAAKAIDGILDQLVLMETRIGEKV